MLDATIKIDPSQLASVMQLLGYKDGRRVISRAINKVGTAARRKISVEIRNDMPIKQSDLYRRSLKLTKSTYSSLEATISVSGKRIPLKDFRPRQTKKGVSYSVRKGQRSRIKDAFIVRSIGDHVFSRVTTARTPIRKLYGPSVPHVFGNIRELSEQVLDRDIAEKLSKEIETQVQLALEKRG